MPEAAALTTCDSADPVEPAAPPIVLERPSRLDLVGLWTIAGFDDRRPRLARFVVVVLRPPMVSSTSPRIACELIAPPRTKPAALALCVVGLTIALVATVSSTIVPFWLALVALPTGALAGVMLIERGLTRFAVPADHVRLQDVVAQRRGGGVAHDVLTDLVSTVSRPIVLDVDADATGVIKLYERLGFARTDRPSEKPGIASMTRAAPTATSCVAPSIAGVRPRWLWPSPTEAAAGALAALALSGLHQPGVWSRHVVVAFAAFVVVTAAGTDLRLHRIPNALVVASALPLVWIATSAHITEQALVGTLIMAGPLLASNLATSGRTPGLGDVKLAAVAGSALGMLEPIDAPLAALVLTLIGGAIFGVVYQHRTRSRGFPLGPAIAAATITMLAIEGLQLRSVL